MADKEVHLRDYLAVVRKHDFIVVVSFLLIFGSALTVGLYMPRVYESTVTIEVQASVTSPAISGLMQIVSPRGADQVSMETICKRFTSRSLLDETIRNLKRRSSETYSDLGSPESLASKIRTKIVPDTRMIELAVRMRKDEGGSQRAAEVANELVSVMQRQRGEKTDAETVRRQKFIDDKIKEIESRISDSEQNIRRFLKNSGNSLLWSAHVNSILTRLTNLMDLKESSESHLAIERKKLDELRARLSKEPEFVEYSKTFSRDSLLDKYRLDLAELNESLVAAYTEFGEENPRVKSFKAQIEEIEKKMKSTASEIMSSKTESLSPTRQALLNQIIECELNMIAHSARRDLAERMLNQLNKEKEQIFSEIPENQFQMDKMDREIKYELDIYRDLLERKLEAEIWAIENSVDNPKVKGGIEIVDKAQPESKPVSPRIKFISAIACVVGLAVGLAMAFMAEYFENTYRSPDEAKNDLDVPILGVIPLIKDHQRADLPLPTLQSPASAFAESFRTLVANIEFSSPETPHKALLVTSSGPGEGKSFAVANLAIAMAQTKGQVILVDCDMRKAIQHKVFDVNNHVGLTSLLVGGADLESIIQDTNIPNLRLVCCGPSPPNPVELLRSKRLDEALSGLRKMCDVLLFDCPPILPVADTLILASKLDGILLLVDLGHTSREIIRQAYEQLSRLDTPLLGLICNKVDMAKYNYYYQSREQKG